MEDVGMPYRVTVILNARGDRRVKEKVKIRVAVRAWAILVAGEKISEPFQIIFMQIMCCCLGEEM